MAAGKKITVGIAGANYAIEGARAQYEALAGALIDRGIAVKFLDARLDINRQVSEVDQFVDQGVDAIVVNVAGDPNALLAPLQRASAAGIKIFSIGSTPGFDKDLVEVDLPSEELGDLSAKYMCKATGGKGEIALIEAIDIPVLSARWNAFLATIAKQCPDLKVVATERAIPDDAATTRPIAENLLTRFPNLKAIWAMGDGPALGAGLAVKSAGRDVIVTGLNGESQGLDGVKQGVVAATWDTFPTDIGVQLGAKIADILQGKAPVPTKTEVFTVHNLTEWTSANASKWLPYDKRVKYPGIQ
jgi:ribose transport system substrate-binding protein